MLFERVPIDIVERVVILTDANRDYETISQIIERLREPQRREKIIEAMTKREVDNEGTVRYYLDGVLHRENDKPAIEYASGSKMWYRKGQLHRENDKPAIEYVSGTKYWYYKGQIHRENDKPAVEEVNGTKEWYRKGLLHRENDWPAIEWSDGTKEWWLNGKRISDVRSCSENVF